MKSVLDRYSTLPKYIRLAENLREQIAAGQLRPGDQLPSFIQMREQHGVSQFVLDRAYGVLEKDNLIVRRLGSGTFVAQENTAPKTYTVGISGLGFEGAEYSTYWGKLFQGICGAAMRAKAQLLPIDNEAPDGWEKADGILLDSWTAYHIQPFLPASLPVVSLWQPGADDPVAGSAYVTVDESAGIRQTVEHLVSLGHRHIAYLYAVTHIGPPDRKRLLAYRRALRAAGIKPQAQWEQEVKGLYNYESDFVEVGRRSMYSWLQNGWRESGCTALLAQNDAVALGAMEVLREAGLRVPQDVSVAGFDGTLSKGYAGQVLTTVEVPLQEVGMAATEMLLAHIESGKPDDAKRKVLPVQLRTGETTAHI